MRFLLDTNVVIHALRGRPAGVRERLEAAGPGLVRISAVTVAELCYGAEKSDDAQRRHALFDAFLAPFDILAFDTAAGKLHGILRYQMRHRPIGERDLLIAAIARSAELTLVTANAGEFRRVPDLDVEDWSG